MVEDRNFREKVGLMMALKFVLRLNNSSLSPPR